jgi:uncharacterized protein
LLERDLTLALADPTRHVLVARARDNHQAVGYVDALDDHPEDACPWLGFVEIHASAQRRGLGRQCVDAIAKRALYQLGKHLLHAAVDADDDRAQAFLRSLGFLPVSDRERASPRGRIPVIVYALPLVPESSTLNPNLEIRPSSIEGSGLFAVRPIDEGEICAVLGGQVMTDEHFAEFCAERDRWSAAAIEEGLNLVQGDDDPIARGNHSCDPNLWMTDAITVVERRRIEPGHEATIDYALLTVDDKWTMACRCGSPLCRGVVTGSDWQRRDLQSRYQGHFAPFINQRIRLGRRTT